MIEIKQQKILSLKRFFEIGAVISKDNLEIKAKLKDRHFLANERKKADDLLNSLKDKKAVVTKVVKKGNQETAA